MNDSDPELLVYFPFLREDIIDELIECAGVRKLFVVSSYTVRTPRRYTRMTERRGEESTNQKRKEDEEEEEECTLKKKVTLAGHPV
jgi:hypothetical protein